jgi:Rrf2 family protein
MLSQKAKYAMRALLYLARAEAQQPVFISEIAEQQAVPKKFLELILLDLKRHGLVHSLRGKKGGYLLAKPPEMIFFGQVIRIIDGPLAQLPCASRTAYRRCDDCQDEKTCEIRRVLLQVRDSTARILDNTSLADVMVGGQGELVAGAGI